MSKLSYEALSEQLEDWAGISSCSEIHGLISGLASVGLGQDYARLEAIVMRHVDEADCSERARQSLRRMQETVLEQLEASDFAFETLIPSDDEELYARVSALAQWCQGFLVGFGTGVKTKDSQFSTEAQEVLRDLVEISNVSHEGDEGSEEDEIALVELEEYVRTAVMMLYSEFVLASRQASDTPDTDTLH